MIKYLPDTLQFSLETNDPAVREDWLMTFGEDRSFPIQLTGPNIADMTVNTYISRLAWREHGILEATFTAGENWSEPDAQREE